MKDRDIRIPTEIAAKLNFAAHQRTFPLLHALRVPEKVGVVVRSAVLLCLFMLPSALNAQDATEQVFWESVVCEREDAVRVYLRVHPNGVSGDEARACLEQQLSLSREERILVQQGLASLDYLAGVADGQFGPATRRAIWAWQTAEEFATTGHLTQEQADALITQGQAVVAAAEAEPQQEAEEERQPAAVEEQPQQETPAQAEAEPQREATEEQPQQETPARAEAEPQRAATKRQEEAREWVNSLGMEFVLIEPGAFEMGSPAGEPERDNDETLHPVTLSQPFYLGKYEVTQEQWQAVMGDNPSYFSNCGATCPVEQVSWEDAQSFAEELNAREGVKAYRLPTEAEWEYAARAGTQTTYHFGDGADPLRSHGWYLDNAGETTHPVGEQRPNAWGLYDMHGNVREWVHDWFGAYPGGAVTDPRGPEMGSSRVNRGGSWFSSARYCRAAGRHYDAPGGRDDGLGFRLVRTP